MAAGARSTPTTRYSYLNNIPFADHGALLDPPTEDVTARCISMLAQLGETTRASAPIADGHRLSAPHPAAGRLLVRPLGHELHLRHLVGAVRAQRRRPRRHDDPMIAQGRRLAARDPERRWRLGRGRRELQARLQGLRAGARAPPRRRPGPCLALMAAGEVEHPRGRSAASSYLIEHAERRRAVGRGALHRDRVSRACSTCAITATGSSSRSGRWRAIAI